MAFARKNRLSSGEAINAVVSRGNRFAGNGFVVYLKKSAPGVCKTAVIVSKKTDKRAVARNKLRRQISEAIKKIISGYDECFDIVVYTRPEAVRLGFAELEEGLRKAFKTANRD